MRIKFCILENDEKSFEYVQNCLSLLEKRDKTMIGFDNQIQKKEIESHISRKGIDVNNFEDRNSETIFWINQYACDFRSYHNTLKIAAGLLHYKGIKSDSLTREEFQNCCDAVNNLKDFLIENIF